MDKINLLDIMSKEFVSSRMKNFELNNLAEDYVKKIFFKYDNPWAVFVKSVKVFYKKYISEYNLDEEEFETVLLLIIYLEKPFTYNNFNKVYDDYKMGIYDDILEEDDDLDWEAI